LVFIYKLQEKKVLCSFAKIYQKKNTLCLAINYYITLTITAERGQGLNRQWILNYLLTWGTFPVIPHCKTLHEVCSATALATVLSVDRSVLEGVIHLIKLKVYKNTAHSW